MYFPSVSVYPGSPFSATYKLTLEYKGMCVGSMKVTEVPNPYVNDMRSPTLYRLDIDSCNRDLRENLTAAVVGLLNSGPRRTRKLAIGIHEAVTEVDVYDHMRCGVLFVVEPKQYERVVVCYVPYGAQYPYAAHRYDLRSYLQPLGVVRKIH